MTVGADGKITGKQITALVFFSILILLFFLEVGIRCVGVLTDRSFFYPFQKEGKQAKPYILFRTFGFKLYQAVDDVRYISSSHEEIFPLKKPKNTIRIACFGGSTTENGFAYRTGKVHYPLLLQSILEDKFKKTKFDVINVGYPAYATPHSLILFELDVLSWEPDIVILSHNINDLIASYWPNLDFDYSNKYATTKYIYPRMRRNVSIFEHSLLISFLKFSYRELINLTGGANYPVIRKSQGNNPIPLAKKIFRRNLRSFISLAQSNGIQVLLGTQALQPREDMFLRHMNQKSYNNKVVYPLHEEFVQHHHAFNKVIKKVSLEGKTLFAENDLALGGRMEFFHDFVHYTVTGVKKLAQNYADVLSKSKTVKKLIHSRQTS